MPEADRRRRERTYSIAEVEQLTGLPAHTLRWYESLGLVGEISRCPNGRRQYSAHDLRRVEFVALTREMGMSVADLVSYVGLTREGHSTVPQRLRMLERHRGRLQEQAAQLDKQLARTCRCISSYHPAQGRAATTDHF